MMGEGNDARVCLTTWIVVALMMMCSCLLVEGSHVVYEQLQSTPASIVNNTYRTGYHFQPPQHWINDPNGPMYYNGIYHLFYQYNPYGSVWDNNIEWAHSVSKDLINWISVEPAAIAPSKPFDINGCWSGSATIIPGRGPVILYTGKDSQNRQVQNIAIPKNVSDPYLREWIKPDWNPLMVPVGGINASEFRDPTTAWRAPDNRWRVVVGSLRKHRGMAILYRSKDFVNWIRAKHPLHSAIGTGMWECPDFYPVSLEGKQGLDTSAYGSGLKHVFKVSLDLTRYEYYTLGTYDLDKDRYVPDTKSIDYGSGLRYDYGNFYASKSFFDAAKRRRILWGWSNESDTRQNDKSKGWAGIQTIPRDVWLDTNGRQLVQWPVEELEGLRGKRVSIQNKKIKSGDVVEVKGITAAQADVEVAFQLSSLAKAEPFDPSRTDPQQLCEQKGADAKGGVGPFGLLVLASGDRREQTAVFFRIFKAYTKYVVLMCHDVSRSSLRPELYKPTFGGFIDVSVGEYGMISLRSLIDHSVVESFGAKGRTCITSRVYPSIALGQNAHLFAFNYGTEEVKITQLKAWQMKKPLMNEA